MRSRSPRRWLCVPGQALPDCGSSRSLPATSSPPDRRWRLAASADADGPVAGLSRWPKAAAGSHLIGQQHLRHLMAAAVATPAVAGVTGIAAERLAVVGAPVAGTAAAVLKPGMLLVDRGPLLGPPADKRVFQRTIAPRRPLAEAMPGHRHLPVGPGMPVSERVPTRNAIPVDQPGSLSKWPQAGKRMAIGAVVRLSACPKGCGRHHERQQTPCGCLPEKHIPRASHRIPLRHAFTDSIR